MSPIEPEMVPLHVQVPVALMDRVREVAIGQGRSPLAVITRRALEEFVAKHEGEA